MKQKHGLGGSLWKCIKPFFLWFTTQLCLPGYNFIPLLTAVANIKLFVSLVIAETAVMVPVSQFWMGCQVCLVWLLDSGPFFPISLQELRRIGTYLLLHAMRLKDFSKLKDFRHICVWSNLSPTASSFWRFACFIVEHTHFNSHI